jgi:DNA-binding GntR family transcriptional regulator
VKVNEPITNCLIDQIRTKYYPIGSVLPTEQELQQKFNASRYAVRESLRELVAMGLISRKPKTGSVVVSSHEERSFVQSHGSINDLFTYIKNSKLIVIESSEICVSENQFDDFALPIGAIWKKVKVIRQKIRPALPLVASEIYVPVVYSRIEAYLGSLKVPIYVLLEKITGFKITKVDQRISGCLISKSQSKYLGVRSGSAGLNIVRHYYGMQNKLLLVTNSIYRADQYTYQVSLNYDQSLSSSRP